MKRMRALLLLLLLSALAAACQGRDQTLPAAPTAVAVSSPLPTETSAPTPASSALSAPTPTAETVEQAGFAYAAQPDGTAVITRWSGDDETLVVPETLGEYSVTGIGEEAFLDCASLVSVALPDGLFTIGRDAFSGCAALTEITIPGSVTEMGTGVFSYCGSLERVVIEEGVTHIGNYLFGDCDTLETLTLPASVVDIAEFALSGFAGTIHCPAGSYAERFAEENELPCVTE